MADAPKPTQNLSQLALAVQKGTLDITTLPDETRAKIRRLGPITLGGTSVGNDGARPSRASKGLHSGAIRHARAS